MATFALIHGGGDGAWHWGAVANRLRERGHEPIPVHLPTPDPEAGLADWAEAVVTAVGEHDDVVVVAHSLGGFIGPLVCDRVSPELLVLVAPMIPAPGESVNEWWTNTAHAVLDPDDDEAAQFYHDVPAAVVDDAEAHARDVADTAMGQPWPLSSWPDTPTRVLACRDDRFFPLDFARRVAVERLGLVADEIDGGHCVHLSRPDALADRLVAYWTDHRAE